MEIKEISLGRLTKDELEKIKDECKEEILKINDEYGDGRISIEDEIEKLAQNLQTQIEIWLDHNLTYISNHIACIVPLKTDEVTKGVINSMVNRFKKIRQEYKKLRSAQSLKSKDLSFNAANILYIRHQMLPLVAQTDILKEEVLLITNKIYKP